MWAWDMKTTLYIAFENLRMQKIRVAIADDHQLILDGLRNIIEKENTLQFVFEASNGAQVIENLNHVDIDVLLVDLDMPKMNGFDTLKSIKESNADIRIIILSVHEEPAIIKKAIQIGCDGYIFKRSEPSDIVDAIRQVSEGKKYFSSEVTMAVAASSNSTSSSYSSDSFSRAEQLSEREMEVLKLIVDGLSSTAIADKLFLSKRTIDAHRNNILRKLEVKNTVELVKFALQSGIA
jgi:DNA-binding NarL/FixJ family response regulator